MEKELSSDLLLPEPVDKKIAVVEKVAESAGMDLDIAALELQVENLMIEYVGQLGLQAVTVMKSRLQNLPVPQGLNRYHREQWKKNLTMFERILNDNSSQANLDMFKNIKLELMSKKLNMRKNEHDTIFIKPHHKTIGHVEVKAMRDFKNNEVKKALDQLEGGKEEMLRAHGHLLDSDWSYLGIISLPNLPQNLKPTMCRNMKLCNHCADYILVGDEVNTGMKFHLDSHFSAYAEFADESVLLDQYKKIASRLLAMEHLRPPVSTVQRIAGTEKEVLAGFSGKGGRSVYINMQVKDWPQLSCQKGKSALKKLHSKTKIPQEIAYLSCQQQMQTRSRLGRRRGTWAPQLPSSFSHKTNFRCGKRKMFYSLLIIQQVGNHQMTGCQDRIRFLVEFVI